MIMGGRLGHLFAAQLHGKREAGEDTINGPNEPRPREIFKKGKVYSLLTFRILASSTAFEVPDWISLLAVPTTGWFVGNSSFCFHETKKKKKCTILVNCKQIGQCRNILAYVSIHFIYRHSRFVFYLFFGLLFFGDHVTLFSICITNFCGFHYYCTMQWSNIPFPDIFHPLNVHSFMTFFIRVKTYWPDNKLDCAMCQAAYKNVFPIFSQSRII